MKIFAPPGFGKTTLAYLLYSQLNFVAVETDVLRTLCFLHVGADPTGGKDSIWHAWDREHPLHSLWKQAHDKHTFIVENLPSSVLYIGHPQTDLVRPFDILMVSLTKAEIERNLASIAYRGQGGTRRLTSMIHNLISTHGCLGKRMSFRNAYDLVVNQVNDNKLQSFGLPKFTEQFKWLDAYLAEFGKAMEKKKRDLTPQRQAFEFESET